MGNKHYELFVKIKVTVDLLYKKGLCILWCDVRMQNKIYCIICGFQLLVYLIPYNCDFMVCVWVGRCVSLRASSMQF
jgi:hypothetical protein